MAFFKHIEESKLRKKKYPENYALVIYSRFACKNFDLQRLSALFVGSAPKLAGIWALLNIAPDQTEHLLTKLYPDRMDVRIELRDICSDDNCREASDKKAR